MVADLILANDGVQYADASGSKNSPPIGFKNLQASATGLSALVAVTADEVSMATTAAYYLTARSVSLSINSASSGANGLDTGTIAASTWYSVWVISNGATTAGLLSTSATAPTMPSGYTFKARVGWIRTDGTANKYPLSFKQYGRRVQYVVAAGTNLTALPLMSSGVQGVPGTPTWVAVAWATYVPSTAGEITAVINTGNVVQNVIASPSNAYGGYASTTNPPLLNCSNSAQANSASMVLESANVYWASASSGAAFQCLGWTDNI